MNPWLQKLPDPKRSPSGLEWRILRKLPMVTLAGTLIPLFCYLFAVAFPAPAEGTSVAKYLMGIEIVAIASVITVWTAVFTIAIGCVVVVLMKGPGYVADRYDLIDADEPRNGQEPERKKQGRE